MLLNILNFVKKYKLYVQDAARKHFGCPTMVKVELENHAAAKTSGHWEQRLNFVRDEYITIPLYFYSIILINIIH